MVKRRGWLWLGIGVVSTVSLWALWVVTGPRIQLPDGAQEINFPRSRRSILAISPDGRRLASNVRRPDGHFVVEVRALKGDRTSPSTFDGVFPVWLPDGTLVSFQDARYGSNSSLHLDRQGERESIPLPRIGFLRSVFYDPKEGELLFSDHVEQTRFAYREWRFSISSRTMVETHEPLPMAYCNCLYGDGSVWLTTGELENHTSVYALFDRNQHGLQVAMGLPGIDDGRLRPLALAPGGSSAIFALWDESPRSAVLNQAVSLVWSTRFTRRLFDAPLSALRERSRVSSLIIYDFQTSSFQTLGRFEGGWLEAVWHPNGEDLIIQMNGRLWQVRLPLHLWSKPAPGYRGGK